MQTKISKNRFQKIKTRSLRKNPLPWLLLILVSGAWFYIFSYPSVAIWMTKTKEIGIFEVENPKKEAEAERVTQELKELENRFRVESSAKKREEEQIFPKDISVFSTIKTLEIYSFLLHYDRDRSSNFKLLSVNFGEAAAQEGLDYDKSSINISIEGNRESIIEFIDFIERGKPSSDFETRFKKQDDDPEVAKSIAFLKDRFLPIATIENIRIGTKNTTEVQNLVTANLSLSFYSRGEAIDNKTLVESKILLEEENESESTE